MFRTAWLLLIFLCPGLVSGQILGRRIIPQEPPPTPATWAERNQQSPLCQACEVESLALPLCIALASVRPRRVPAGECALPQYGTSRQHLLLWRVIPWQVQHAEFLELYETLKDRSSDGVELEREKTRLFIWCEKKKLPVCAEFVLRDFLYTRGVHHENSVYQKNLQRWKELAKTEPIPYTFRLPVQGQWHALLDESGHHQKKHGAVFAFDIVRQVGGHLHAGANAKENHFAWRQPVLAVCDGVITAAVDKHNDHTIGRPGPLSYSNHIRLDCGGGVFAEYHHLQKDSLRVKVGDKVEAGQVLGNIGNSGASGVPHLHFSFMDRDGFSLPGRYRLRVLAAQGWTNLNGEDIAEGWHFRSVD
ncbi:M23 family metallopeptidase [Lignipirellula cremea]|uniref:Glycyl-glycine endopeptidase ALE-1 n=1 Tax=Lignipirellula cremea TaxID=2528010 RepID=A0A518DZ63_9BACT|nr:M23 family metallopeptidase [Lignipirellula cremea]QDU97105.1 Glycyl-glycine endopeptidase ALE-1 precursor [Lignipirellula cremea]